MTPAQLDANRPAWLTEAVILDLHSHSGALDVLFHNYNELLSSGRFTEVDELFAAVPAGVSLTFLLGVLSITLPATARLANRMAFFDRVWGECLEKNRDAERLLSGLKEWKPMFTQPD